MDSASIFGALLPRVRQVPFYTQVPVESSAGANSSFVGENAAIPVCALDLNQANLPAYKLMSLCPVSKTLLRKGGPEAERAIVDAVTQEMAGGIDQALLDPAQNVSLERASGIVDQQSARLQFHRQQR